MLKAIIPTVRNVFLSIQQNLTEEKRQEKIVCVEGKIIWIKRSRVSNRKSVQINNTSK